MSSVQAGIDITVTSIAPQGGLALLSLELRNPIALQRNGVFFRLYCGDPERPLIQAIAASEAGMAQAERVAAESGPARIVLVPGGFPGHETVEVTMTVDAMIPASTSCRAEMRGVW